MDSETRPPLDKWEEPTPQTVTEAMLLMGKQMAKYRQFVAQAKDAELLARAARRHADVAESTAYMYADPPETFRRHAARIADAVVAAKVEADRLEVEFAHIKRCIEGCREQINVYRSEGGYLKAELATLGSTPDTWT